LHGCEPKVYAVKAHRDKPEHELGYYLSNLVFIIRVTSFRYGVNGRTANVDFGDRFNTNIGYDYDLERTTNGWKVIGVGYREAAPKAGR